MQHLPPLPPTLPLLTDEQIERADRTRAWPPDKASIDEWCPTCFGEKKFDYYVPDDLNVQPYSARAIDTYECDCRAQFKLWRLFSYANLGDRYGRLSWGDTVGIEASVLGWVYDYARSAEAHLQQGNGLFLWGRNGNGKTLLATLLLRRFMAAGHTGYFTTYNELLEQWVATWGSGNRSEKEYFQALIQHTRVLIIDDLGKESSLAAFQESAVSALDLVLRARVQNGFVTILTTNMRFAPAPPEVDEDLPEKKETVYEREVRKRDLYKRYSRSMVSLITEACLLRQFTADDWRAQSRDVREYEASRNIRRPYTLK